MLINEKSERGLLLVAQHGGFVGPFLWLSICQNLWTAEKVDFSGALLQKWLVLLLGSVPETNKSNLGHFLLKVGKAEPRTLGILLFKFLTNLRISVGSGFDWDFEPGADSIETHQVAEFGITLVGESLYLEQAWRVVFKPLIPELGLTYLRILQDRLVEIFNILRVAGKANERYDPWSRRGNIADRDANRGHHDNSLIVDCLLDVVEGMSEKPGTLSTEFIKEWILADCPSLVRIGLLALLMSKAQSGTQKVKLLMGDNLIYSQVYGTSNEIHAILAAAYPEISSEERAELWKVIEAGPKYPKSPRETDSEWEKYRQWQIEDLTKWLASRNSECPLAASALKKLNLPAPGVEEEGVEVHAVSGKVIEMGQSPKSAADLLSQTVDSQIEFLLNYKGESWPSGVTRSGLVAQVGEAVGAGSKVDELSDQKWNNGLGVWTGVWREIE